LLPTSRAGQVAITGGGRQVGAAPRERIGPNAREYLHNDEWSAEGLKVAFGYNESNKTSWWATFEIDRK